MITINVLPSNTANETKAMDAGRAWMKADRIAESWSGYADRHEVAKMVAYARSLLVELEAALDALSLPEEMYFIQSDVGQYYLANTK